MSTYLARLARGIEGAEAVGVRPRLPSIFEPVDRGTVPVPIVNLPIEESRPADERPSPEQGKPRAAVRAAERRDRVTSASPLESERRRAPPDRARPLGRRDEAAEPRVPPADEPAPISARVETPLRVVAVRWRPQLAVVGAPRHGVAPTPPAATSPTPKAPAVLEHVREFMPPLEPTSQTDVDRAPAMPLAPPRSPPRRNPRPTAPVPSGRPLEPAASTLPAAAIAPLPIPEPRRLIPAGSAEPPIVRITIGRIDVRAVPAPTPTEVKSRPARRKPAMSLEEYLERRNGRRS